MDSIDKAILSILAENSASETIDISKKINLSVPATNKRIAKLKKTGVISDFTIIADNDKIGKSVISFILVTLQYSCGCEDFLEFVKNDKDILECYAISGGYDYILKACAKDIKVLEKKILEIKVLNGVVKTQTMISLMNHKFVATALPDEDE